MVLAFAMLAVPAGPAAADWRSETGTFRIGLVARADRGGPSAGYDQAAAAISEAIGMPVEFVSFPGYPALIDAQAASRVEYGIYSATAYGAASALCECLVPLAAPVTESGLRSMLALAVSTDPAIAAPDDIAGGRLAWVAPAGAAPAVLTATQFTIAGKPVQGDEAYLVPVATPSAAVAALAAGEADATLAWAYADDDGAPVEGSGMLGALDGAGIDYQVIWRSPALRLGPHAVRKDVPADIREALTAFLTEGLRDRPEIADLMDESFHGRFETVQEQDYRIAVRYAESLRGR